MKQIIAEETEQTVNLSFGAAIEAVKRGKKISRVGWNGKGMYVFLAQGDSIEFTTDADMSEFVDREFEVADMLVLRTAQGNLQPGWLATQSDMLADDWCIVG